MVAIAKALADESTTCVAPSYSTKRVLITGYPVCGPFCTISINAFPTAEINYGGILVPTTLLTN